jgi:acetoacetate decarboxylase
VPRRAVLHPPTEALRYLPSSNEADLAEVKASLEAPNFLLKIIPHVDGKPRICELVEYRLEKVVLKGAWTGPAALCLSPHALAPVAELPVLDVVSAIHIVADLTLGLGKVVHDYLRQPTREALRRQSITQPTLSRPLLRPAGVS